MGSSFINISNASKAFITHHWKFKGYEHRFSSLYEGLSTLLPHIDQKSWEERSELGGIYVNGLEAPLHSPLPCPWRIEYYEPKIPLDEFVASYPRFDPNWIVWEDEYFVATYKPRGLPTIPAREQKHFSLRQYLEKYYERPLHLPSRLDFSTQGLVIGSKTEGSHKLLQHLFEKRTIKKSYRFSSSFTPQWTSRTVQCFLAPHPELPVLRVPSEEGKGKYAETHFTLLATTSEGSILEARPITGRTHQIRVHAAHEGLPLLGDYFYGGEPSSMLHLVSYALQFVHPVTGKDLAIVAPQEKCPLWVHKGGEMKYF